MSLGGGGQGQQQLQQLSQELQAIDAEIEGIDAEIEEYRQEQRDIDDAKEALETLDSGSTVQVPLGGGAFVRAEIADIDEVIVSLGGGYAAEREEEGAISSLETKKDTIDERIEELQAQVSELDSEAEQLEQQAQQMQQQQMQQMMQQQQAEQGEQDGE